MTKHSQLDAPDAAAQYRAVIYLSGANATQLDDAERRCREYAREFNWQVLKSVRDNGDRSNLLRLLSELDLLAVQIIVTGNLDMISPDQDTRDDVMAAIERSRCFVHPVCISWRARPESEPKSEVLKDLRRRWGDVYMISACGDEYEAIPRFANGQPLTGSNPDELLRQMAHRYAFPGADSCSL